MNDFASILNQFAATAGNVYGSLNQPKNATAATATPVITVSQTPAWQQYLPWGIGGLVLLVIVILVAKK